MKNKIKPNFQKKNSLSSKKYRQYGPKEIWIITALFHHCGMSAHPVLGTSLKLTSRIIAWLITHSLGSIQGQASEWALMGLERNLTSLVYTRV